MISRPGQTLGTNLTVVPNSLPTPGPHTQQGGLILPHPTTLHKWFLSGRATSCTLAPFLAMP